MDKQTTNTMIAIAGMVLGALAMSRNPQAAAGLMQGGQAAAINNQLSYSRDAEREADRLGLQILRGAGFELNGMGDFREEASALRDFFSNVIDQEDQLTAAEFMKHMTFLKNDPNPDIAISQQLYFAEHVECELQRLGRNIEPDPQRVLIDEQYYPLYILTLFANTDAGDGRPLLLSEEGFEKQMSEEPIPDPQVEPAI
jgi:predicted Zn-dependent protease